jgi:hypothetical protein
MIQNKEVIFLFPYLNVNTTSAERFKSFIEALKKQTNTIVRVLLIDYSISQSYFTGLDHSLFENDRDIEFEKFELNPNIIQRCGFFSLEHGFKYFWRIFQLLHLIIYRTDIFSPYGLEKAINPIANEGYVIVSGSHFSYFSIGNKIAKKSNYQLVLDYRDPWTFGYSSVDGFSFIHQLKIKINRNKEQYLLREASVVSTVSKTLISQFPLAYQTKIKLVPNGSNFKSNEVEVITNRDSFNILYAGTIYNEQLKNNIFFEAFSKFITNKAQAPIKLQFIGSSKNRNLLEMISRYNLEDYVDMTNRITKPQLLKYFNNASVFLHLKYGDKKDIISSKQAEYLTFRRPILLPISDEGDLKESIISNSAGYVCHNNKEIIQTLELLYDKFLNKENLFIKQPEEFINNLSRDKIGENFAKEVLDFS